MFDRHVVADDRPVADDARTDDPSPPAEPDVGADPHVALDPDVVAQKSVGGDPARTCSAQVDQARERIARRTEVLTRRPDVAPVRPRQRETVEPIPPLLECGKDVPPEIVELAGGDVLENRRLEAVDPRVHQVRELLTRGRFLLELDDPAFVVEDHDAVLIDAFHLDEADRGDRLSLTMKGDERLEVRVGEIVATDDDERLVEKRFRLLHRPGAPAQLVLIDVVQAHPVRRTVAEIIADRIGEVMDVYRDVDDPKAAQIPQDVRGDRLARNRDERLGNLIRQRIETSAAMLSRTTSQAKRGSASCRRHLRGSRMSRYNHSIPKRRNTRGARAMEPERTSNVPPTPIPTAAPEAARCSPSHNSCLGLPIPTQRIRAPLALTAASTASVSASAK